MAENDKNQLIVRNVILANICFTALWSVFIIFTGSYGYYGFNKSIAALFILIGLLASIFQWVPFLWGRIDRRNVRIYFFAVSFPVWIANIALYTWLNPDGLVFVLFYIINVSGFAALGAPFGSTLLFGYSLLTTTAVTLFAMGRTDVLYQGDNLVLAIFNFFLILALAIFGSIIRESKRRLRAEHNQLIEQQHIIQSQLEVAQKIQQSLIPHIETELNAFNFKALYIPMHEVGGDFYDVITLNDHNSFGYFIADVSGHGVPAAMISAMLKSFNNSMAPKLRSPGEYLEQLNLSLYPLPENNFITVFYAIFDASANKLTYASAGHDPALYINHQGGVQWLSGKGRAIGLSVMTRFQDRELDLNKNDRIYLYTDGATEIFDDKRKMFGQDRLGEVLVHQRQSSLTNSLTAVYDSLISFQNNDELGDDLTLLGIEIR